MIESDEIRLSTPDPRFRESFLEAMREFEEAGEDNDLPALVETIAEDFSLYVERKLYLNANPLPGFVPQTPFWITRGDDYVGRLNIRHYLNEKLRLFGGHIGYAVRPSMRRKGYGTRALALGLVEARKLGLERVLVTCDDGNIGSKKIIEANGGVLEDKVETSDHEGLTCRYWIDVW